MMGRTGGWGGDVESLSEGEARGGRRQEAGGGGRGPGCRNPLSPLERMLLCGVRLSGAATCPRHL